MRAAALRTVAAAVLLTSTGRSGWPQRRSPPQWPDSMTAAVCMPFQSHAGGKIRYSAFRVRHLPNFADHVVASRRNTGQW